MQLTGLLFFSSFPLLVAVVLLLLTRSWYTLCSWCRPGVRALLVLCWDMATLSLSRLLCLVGLLLGESNAGDTSCKEEPLVRWEEE